MHFVESAWVQAIFFLNQVNYSCKIIFHFIFNCFFSRCFLNVKNTLCFFVESGKTWFLACISPVFCFVKMYAELNQFQSTKQTNAYRWNQCTLNFFFKSSFSKKKIKSYLFFSAVLICPLKLRHQYGLTIKNIY